MNIQSNSDASERVWKFLHGEMDPAEKSAFEALIQIDARLAAELQAQRQLHLLLVNAGREALVDRLLAEHEADVASATTVPCKRPRSNFQGRSRLLALAACVAVVAGILWAVLPRSPLRWEPPRVIATAWMGSGGATAHDPRVSPSTPPGRYSNTTLLKASRELMAAVDRFARGLGVGERNTLATQPLRLSVQEIFAGQITVALEIPGREAWTANLASLTALQEQTPALAEQIVAHLRDRSALSSP